VIINLAHYLFGSSPATQLCRLFREYAKIYLEFLDVAERRAVGLATSRTAVEAWKTTFALQRALKERQVSRVEHLLRAEKPEYLSWMDLNQVTERVEVGWVETEEALLLATSRDYASLSILIVTLQSGFDRETLMANYKMLEQDAQYSKARERLSAKSSEMSKLFKRAIARHAA
jgi:hypothetical protein